MAQQHPDGGADPVRSSAGNGFDRLAAAAPSSCKRWPRDETVALIEIRSEMEAAFREAAFKAPLWEEVARKLGEKGYCRRSANKCREKFENVDKYYKRTKDARAGRLDGKTYHYFSQLEALHAASAPVSPAMTLLADAAAHMPPGFSNPTPISAAPPADEPHVCSDSESSEDEEAMPMRLDSCKLQRASRTMELLESLMAMLMEQQERLQRRFLATLEKREQERVAWEEARRRQEVARLSREHELVSQERTAAASRHAALIALLHKLDGQAACTISAAGMSTDPQHSGRCDQGPPPSESSNNGNGHGRSRWPKAEVEALIEVRKEVGARSPFPFWEEISTGMRRLGYDRNPRRCKEKWQNINKYFRKARDERKHKRPRRDESRSCPYFPQLEQLYEQSSRNVSNLLILSRAVDGQLHQGSSVIDRPVNKDEQASAGDEASIAEAVALPS